MRFFVHLDTTAIKATKHDLLGGEVQTVKRRKRARDNITMQEGW
jgi:hypothetical protein